MTSGAQRLRASAERAIRSWSTLGDSKCCPLCGSKESEVLDTSWETYAGQKTCWIGTGSLRVRATPRAPGMLLVEKDTQSVTMSPAEARALAMALLEHLARTA